LNKNQNTGNMFFGAINQPVNNLSSGQVLPNIQHQQESLNS
jgi:hypothetical protein